MIFGDESLSSLLGHLYIGIDRGLMVGIHVILYLVFIVGTWVEVISSVNYWRIIISDVH